MRLDIGCGGVPEPGFTGVDAFVAADVKAQMWDLPFADGTIDEIWSSHALEHVPRARVLPTLREWARVLKPSGPLMLKVPNLDYACRLWLEKPGDAWALAVLFGNQQHAGEFHQTGWNARMLAADLAEAGFHADVVITWDHDQETLRAAAVALPRKGA